MAINVYEYGIQGTCVKMFRYSYAGIREMKIQKEKEDRHMSKVMSTSIGTKTQVSIKIVEKEGKKKMVINIEQNTNHTYEYGEKFV